MSKNTSAALIKAAQDKDLLDRATAIAAELGIPMPQAYIGNRMLQLAAQPVNEAGDTVASVFEYAVATYVPTPRPGENPAAVTDDFLRAALTSLQAIDTPVQPGDIV